MDNEERSDYGKRPLWQWITLYIVVAVVAYGLVYYFVLAKNGGSYNNTIAAVPNSAPTVMQQAAPSQASSPSATTEPSKMQKITVVGTEFAFSPSAITLKNGQAVELTFKNNGAYPHNLTITDLDVKTKTIQPGEEDTVQFTPTKTGQFSFVCTVPGHVDKGMKGILTVQ